MRWQQLQHIMSGSYVSLQMALSYYHLIPEHVAVVTSVTIQRPVFPGTVSTNLLFSYAPIKRKHFQ
jgi:hypothetical protein